MKPSTWKLQEVSSLDARNKKIMAPNFQLSEGTGRENGTEKSQLQIRQRHDRLSLEFSRIFVLFLDHSESHDEVPARIHSQSCGLSRYIYTPMAHRISALGNSCHFNCSHFVTNLTPQQEILTFFTGHLVSKWKTQIGFTAANGIYTPQKSGHVSLNPNKALKIWNHKSTNVQENANATWLAWLGLKFQSDWRGAGGNLVRQAELQWIWKSNVAMDVMRPGRNSYEGRTLSMIGAGWNSSGDGSCLAQMMKLCLQIIQDLLPDCLIETGLGQPRASGWAEPGLTPCLTQILEIPVHVCWCQRPEPTPMADKTFSGDLFQLFCVSFFWPGVKNSPPAILIEERKR